MADSSPAGDGAWSITPRIVAEICGNGLQIVADVARAVHLGSRQDEGVIRYTADTQSRRTNRTDREFLTDMLRRYGAKVVIALNDRAGLTSDIDREDTIKASALAGRSRRHRDTVNRIAAARLALHTVDQKAGDQDLIAVAAEGVCR